MGWEPLPAVHPDSAVAGPVRWDGPLEITKDGRTWEIGTGLEVAWIADAVVSSETIAAAIPPVFGAYATFQDPNIEPDSIRQQECSVVEHLTAVSGDQSWWLGFLDTGAHDVVFPLVPKVSLYWNWEYVLVRAACEQALTWRVGHMRSENGVLPDLFFPEDRSWLVSALWDDTWTCVGGDRELVDRLCADPLVRARRVPASFV